MLERQLESARQSDLDPSRTPALEGELAALAADSTRFPWQGGMPSAIENSFVPYRSDLDAVFCDGATELELLRNTRRFLAIESD